MDTDYKRTDKETQSPVLKVFKDMMQREKNDPEKANLLKENQDNRNRRQYSGSRKADRHSTSQKSRDSSSSARHKRPSTIQHKAAVKEQKTREYDQYRSESTPFQGDKKETWWFGESQKKQSEESLSRVSCALHKIISSEYACISCLAVLFVVSVVAAFLVLFRAVPIIGTTDVDVDRKATRLNSDTMRKKMDMLRNGRGYDDDAFLEGADTRPSWDDKSPGYLSGLTNLVGSGYAEDTYRERNGRDNFLLKSDSELSSILDPDKLNDLSSEKLRSFYKKLVQTDTQIRNMKKGFDDRVVSMSPMSDRFDFMSDRKKRCLGSKYHFKVRAKRNESQSKDNGIHNRNPSKSVRDIPRFNLHFPTAISIVNTTGNKVKRFANDTKEPTGFLVEKKQIVVQYKPNGDRRKVPKCSHAPKDSKSHETQLKHPFYKNTQRLDELLDQLLDRNIPEMMVDPFGIEIVFKSNDTSEQIPHNKYIDEIQYPYNVPKSSLDSTTKNIFELFNPTKRNMEPSDFQTTISPYFDAVLGVSMVNPTFKNADYIPLSNHQQNEVHIRKLMQVHEEDDETLGYEDVNEVLADEIETHDEVEKGFDREKSMDDESVNNFKTLPNPVNLKMAEGVHNPNWKGPMPLYRDEIMSMIKHAALLNMYNINKANLPTHNTDSLLEVEDQVANLDSGMSDMEYIESNSKKKSNKLAKMAQAYSDYGVFNEKKDITNTEKNPIKHGKLRGLKEKLYKNKAKLFKHSLLKKDSTSEGFRFEMRPASTSEDGFSGNNMLRKFEKHVRFGSPDKLPIENLQSHLPILAHTTAKMRNTDFALFSAVHKNTKPASSVKNTNDNSFAINFSKGSSRSLLSISSDGNEEVEDGEKQIDRKIKREVKLDTIGSENKEISNDIKSSPLTFNTDSNNLIKGNGSKSSSDINLSDFFMMVSNWFIALAMSADKQGMPNSSKNHTDVMKLIANKLQKTHAKNKTLDILYPNYDSDMIQNIGHRSRVLMSIEDNKHVTRTFESTREEKYEQPPSKTVSDLNQESFKITSAASSETVPEPNHKNETTEKDVNVGATSVDKSGITSANKSKMKRNVDNSDAIFWNGIYDDEYGVKEDPLDNAFGDKQYAKGIDFIKRSSSWIQSKMKNFADNIRRKEFNKKVVPEKKISRGLRYLRSDSARGPYRRIRKRNAGNPNKEEANQKAGNFEALTAKMKAVCKEAAKAVQQTQNIKTRRDEKDETMSTSLMQQLVRLMTDLVDFQVQQKTCLRLTPDLQEFLDWLTAAGSDKTDSMSRKMEPMADDSELSPNTELPIENIPDDRSECLGTLHGIEDLIQQYDEMTDEEKSKMVGVREYLENQMQYLQRQLLKYDEYSAPLYQDPMRFRRDLSSTPLKKSHHHRNRGFRNRFRRKFLKNFAKKHTRTTASMHDGYQTIEMGYAQKHKSNSINGNNKGDVNVEKANRMKEGKFETKLDSRNGVAKQLRVGAADSRKRNLKDVYYKALEDARKFTTVKSVHKKAVDGFDEVHIVKIV